MGSPGSEANSIPAHTHFELFGSSYKLQCPAHCTGRSLATFERSETYGSESNCPCDLQLEVLAIFSKVFDHVDFSVQQQGCIRTAQGLSIDLEVLVGSYLHPIKSYQYYWCSIEHGTISSTVHSLQY